MKSHRFGRKFGITDLFIIIFMSDDRVTVAKLRLLEMVVLFKISINTLGIFFTFAHFKPVDKMTPMRNLDLKTIEVIVKLLTKGKLPKSVTKIF